MIVILYQIHKVRVIGMSFSARELLARLIKCEAGGEGVDGMKAVATVVMNRVHASYGEYLRVCQGDLRKVIFQPRQFTCVMGKVYGEVNPQQSGQTHPSKFTTMLPTGHWQETSFRGGRMPLVLQSLQSNVQPVLPPNRYRQICNPCQPALFLQTY